MTTYHLTLADGPEPAANGIDLGSPDSPLEWDDLPASVQATLRACGFTDEAPGDVVPRHACR